MTLIAPPPADAARCARPCGPQGRGPGARLPRARHPAARCFGACPSRSRPARPTVWSARAAAASRRRPTPPSGTCLAMAGSPVVASSSRARTSPRCPMTRSGSFRTHHASMVYQDPGSALNPSTRIGPQVIEAFTVLGKDAKTARDNALGALARVQIADPERVFNRYPHQLSGGMQQRVVIAMALASDPQLLVLDEPTTGLDATVEASVLDLVRTLRTETNAAVLLIAHNLGVIRSICDRVGVMYAGKIVEEGPAVEVFEAPKHPYTVGLLQSLPRHGVRKSQRPLATIPGTLPQIGTPLPTCVFVDRCALATDLCRTTVPPVVPVGDGRWSRCHHIDRIGELAEGVGGRRARPMPRATESMLTLTARVEDVPPVRARGPCPRQGRPGAAGRRDPRPGRGVRLGQVDAGQDDPGHRGRRPGQSHGARRPGAQGHGQPAPDQGQALDPDGLPEPGLGAQPGLERPPDPQPLGVEADRSEGQGRR